MNKGITYLIRCTLKFLSKMLLKVSLLCQLFILLPFVSCIDEKEGNEVNVKVYASMDKLTPVLLKLDDETFIDEEARPDRDMYRRVKTYTDEENNINVYYRVGDRDTSFVYKGFKQKNYMSIMYSRWWDKFFISPEDSVSFNKGHNDVVYYD